tara:strand:+ start:2707 stop:3009 length:303 start_codon:yes stop_codon:yes gene_type:complete
MRNLYHLIILFFFTYSCSGIKEAGSVLRNEKVKSTDEFLIKKKDPLILPPNFEEIPKPGALEKKDKKEDEKIKKILKTPSKISNNNSSTVEDAILEGIRK